MASTAAYPREAKKNVPRYCQERAIARRGAFQQWLSIVVAMGIAVFFAAALVVGTASYVGWSCYQMPGASYHSGKLAAS